MEKTVALLHNENGGLILPAGTYTVKPGRLIINAEKVTVGKKAFTDCYLLQDIEIKASKRAAADF